MRTRYRNILVSIFHFFTSISFNKNGLDPRIRIKRIEFEIWIMRNIVIKILIAQNIAKY